jgi:hypothetical protein
VRRTGQLSRLDKIIDEISQIITLHRKFGLINCFFATYTFYLGMAAEVQVERVEVPYSGSVLEMTAL